MAFDPYDPMGPMGPRGMGAERYLRECMERMYHDLRREIMGEMHSMLPQIAVMNQPANTGGDKVHAGKKPDEIDIKSLSTAPARIVKHRSPDGIFPATGYRAWKAVLTKDGWRLKALGQSEQWEPKKHLEAKCISGKPHPAPNFDCECGIWAFSTPNELMTALTGYTPSVIGPVTLWGRIIECENGFRAQYAYPAELWLLDNSLEELGWTYNVPIRTV